MLAVTKLIVQGRGLAAALLRRAATLELDWELRCKSRFDAIDSAGRRIGVFLPRGTVVRGGDVLVAEDGSLVVVRAAPQPVLVVRPCPEHGAPGDLLRAAYHLGNRHVPVQITPEHLRIEPDHVLADMLRRMHMIVTEETQAFDPEGGAYQAGHEGGPGHGPAQGHAHDHGHAQGHGHGHGSAHEHAHDHAHDPGRGQPHGHPHGPHGPHDH